MGGCQQSDGSCGPKPQEPTPSLLHDMTMVLSQAQFYLRDLTVLVNQSRQPQGLVSLLGSAGGPVPFFDPHLTMSLSALHRRDLLWRQSVQHCERIGNGHAESPAPSPAIADFHSPGEYARCPGRESVPGGTPHLLKMEPACHFRLAHCPLPSFPMPTQAGCWEEAGRRLRAVSLGSGEASSVGDNLSTAEVISL